MVFRQAEVWLSSRITAMHRVVGAFILTFPMLTILAYCTICELCSQRYPNLLPVAGGGDAALTLWITVPYMIATVLPESYS